MKRGSLTNGMIRESMPVCTGVFHAQHNYLHPIHVFIPINRGTKPSCPIYVLETLCNPAARDHCQTKILLTYGRILLPWDVVQQHRDTTPARNIPPRNSRQVQQPRTSHLTPCPWNHYLPGVRGVKWITAPCSKEVEIDLWCWTPAWLPLPSFLSPVDEDMAMLEGQASFQRGQVPNSTDWSRLVGDRCLVPRLLCKSQRVTPSSN